MAAASRLVLIHGLASSPAEFALLRHPLRRAGIDLHCLEVPGYTHGSCAAGAVTWRGWLDQATLALTRLQADDARPLVLGGLCTGAMLAASLAIEQPALAGGLVMLSPLVAYNGWGLPWWYGFRRLAYWMGLSNRFAMRERSPFGVKNERMRQWMRMQLEQSQVSAVGPSSVNLRVVRESERLSRHVCRALPKLQAQTTPVCVIHAREDEICSLASVESTLRRMPAERIRFTVLENSYHMITIDNDRNHVVAQLDCFMASVDQRRIEAQRVAA
jgi:carboxylesterase